MGFTAETAREMSAKANQARWDKWRAKQASRKAEAESHAIPAPKMGELQGIPADEYTAQQLVRTRKQIDLLNDMLEDPELDWKARKAAADAKGRLYEIEAALANRPGPGNRRPTPEPRSRRQPGASLPFAEVPPATSQANPATPPDATPPVP